MKVHASRLPTVGLLLGLSTVLLVGGLARRNANALYASQGWVAHTHEVIESLDELQIAMNDAIARGRGHALAGDESQQRIYVEAIAQVRRRQTAAYQLTSDNSRQQVRLDLLRTLVDARLAQLDVAWHARRDPLLDRVRQSRLIIDGNAQSDRIRALVETMKDEERSLLTARERTERLNSAVVQQSILVGFAASIVMLVAAFLQILRESNRRAAVARENAGLLANAERHGDDLREANEQMVRATIRAHELAEAAESSKTQIEHSERELRMMAELRETFIGILGHDLRNPLSSIEMSAGLLLRDHHLTPRDQLSVGRIVRSSRRMTRMIAQLLDLTRARMGGGFPLEPKAIDLRDICRDVIEEFSAPIQLEIEGDVTGTWDPDRLEEVVSNITGNGIEHATPGTPVVVRVHPEGARVIIEIRNEGVPIAPDVLPFIFEPFRRAKHFERSPSGNLGLGLYIAKQIVLSHGGTLDAHSLDGATTFVLNLPRLGT